MTPLNLIKALAAELQAASEYFILPAQYQAPKKISMYVQEVPQEEFENQSFYPYICVELIGVEDDVDISVASVVLTVGTYLGEKTEGIIDHLNLVEEVRQYLLTHPLIGKKFSAIMPAYTGLVEKRSEFFRYSNIFLQYQVASPSKSEADAFLYGDDIVDLQARNLHRGRRNTVTNINAGKICNGGDRHRANPFGE